MALPVCTRCGKSNPRKMYGLMTLWFGPFVDLPPDHGYFHLCPDCYRTHVHPHLEAVHGRLADLHPLLARHLEGAADGNGGPDSASSRQPAPGSSLELPG